MKRNIYFCNQCGALKDDYGEKILYSSCTCGTENNYFITIHEPEIINREFQKKELDLWDSILKKQQELERNQVIRGNIIFKSHLVSYNFNLFNEEK